MGVKLQNNRRNAFSVSDILNYLWIIVIIVAIIIATVVTENKKKEVVQDLRTTYNTLKQALETAKMNSGTTSNWDYGIADGTINYNEQILDFVQKYMRPYLKGAELYSYKYTKTLTDLGYKEGMKSRDGETPIAATDRCNILKLNDGTIIVVKPQEVKVSSNGANVNFNLGIKFYVDLNGAQKPNTYGKDIFIMQILFDDNAELEFLNPKFVHYDTKPGSRITSSKDQFDRNGLMKNCRKTGGTCGIVIEKDGWQISKDYPW